MPLKKTSKNTKNVETSNAGMSQTEFGTKGRRSSTPLISNNSNLNQKNNIKSALSKSVGPIVNNTLAVVLGAKDDIVPESPGCAQGSRLKIGKILGEGEFGSVYKGTYQLDNGTIVSRPDGKHFPLY